ncbi:hypothetical protein [Ramlibacter sp. WS9]|uniref:DUF6988 family protein n=1 Tax=Ramlibacter sp. WS9 TaxID=1882741 RepID=UPI001143C940|nr:hypothetical protein [Ramlibacter sp. WS9]ROZ68604.1 hypothetical protein EEB15_25310 [Ramlibacter sp. WS9]
MQCNALVRSVYEACFRGLWVNYAAEEHQLVGMRQGVSPKFETIVKQLHRAPGAAPSGVFAQSKALAWDALCDYSHGGGRQLARWQNEEEIGPSHPDHEIPGLLRLLVHFASASSLGMHDAADSVGTLKSEILDELQKALALIERSTSVTSRPHGTG